MNGERFKLNRLVILAPGSSYEVNFHNGVNVIAGPIFTGKTAVLELIDYCLGAKNSPSFPEIRKCSDVLLECQAGGEQLTIRRALGGASNALIYFEATAKNVLEKDMPFEDVLAVHSHGQRSVSSILMSKLGLADIQVKAAPTKAASERLAFGLRDLMAFLFVTQDRMGQKRGFFEDIFYKRIKWRYAFEIIHGIFDEKEAATAKSLKDAQDEQSRIESYIRNCQEFLSRSGVGSAEVLKDRERILQEERGELAAAMEEIQEEYQAQVADSSSLTTREARLGHEIRLEAAEIEELGNTLRKLNKLRVQYEREKQHLEFLSESEKNLSSIPVTRCPSCFQRVSVTQNSESCYVCQQTLPEFSGAVPIRRRLRSLNSRVRDLDSFIKEVKMRLEQTQTRQQAAGTERAELIEALARFEEQLLLPISRKLVEVNEQISRNDAARRELDLLYKMRRIARGEGTPLLAVRERISRLERDLRELKAVAIDASAVRADLATLLEQRLGDVALSNLQPVEVGEDFLPRLRGEEYGSLSSKGAISVVMSLWVLVMAQYGAEGSSAHPGIVLLDSPLGSVGRDHSDPEFKDEQLAQGFYQVLVELHQEFSSELQVIVVDNRPPQGFRQIYSAEFTRDPERGRFGLISDEKQFKIPEGSNSREEPPNQAPPTN